MDIGLSSWHGHCAIPICRGRGTISTSHFDHEAANIVGIPWRLEIDRHMQQLTTGYLRTDDVGNLLWRLPQILLLVRIIMLKRQTVDRVTNGTAAAALQACQDEMTED